VEAEAEQIPYACRDFYAIQSWVALSDSERGMTIASPDAPLVHLGGFSNHQFRERLEMAQPYLVGWPLNNHWFTNFCLHQSGWMRFRYRLLPHEGPLDRAAAHRFGTEAMVEPLVGPVWDRPVGLEQRAWPGPVHLPEEAHFLALEPAHVHLVGLRPATDGRGTIVRVQEVAGEEGNYVLRFPLSRVATAEACNLVEDSTEGPHPMVTEHEVHGRIEPHRLQTLRVVLAP
jgi:alpha-mannosidase